MASENKSKVSILTNGIIKENPVLRLVLGTCSILAVTTAVSSALGMGAAFTFVLVCSNILISLLRNVIPAKVHLPCYIVIIAGFVTIVQMVMHAYMESLYTALGVFLPLIVVNCIILGRAEMFACKNSVVDSALDGVGMGIGYKTTNYDTFLTNLTHQKMSYAKFDSTYVQNYIANKTPFETAMADVKANFGLTLPTDPDAANAGKLLLTDYEVENLRKAYERTLEVGSSSQSKMSQEDYELYGTYIPFSMAVCHTINHKSGMDHTTYAHTGAMVNVYAKGVGAENFGGVYDNTEIYHKLADLTRVQ